MNYKILIFSVFAIAKFGTIANGQSCQLGGQNHYNYKDVKFILDKNKCNTCHENQGSAQWTYDEYSDFFTIDKCGQSIVKPRDLNNSSIVDKLNGGNIKCGHSMPLGGTAISASDLLAIESWIQFGAPEFCVENYETIKSLLNGNKCQSCHFAGSTAAPWAYSDYSSLLATSANCGMPIVQKYDAFNSILYQKIEHKSKLSCGAFMYNEGEKVDALSIAKIRDWINAGAPEFSAILPVSLAYFDVKSVNNEKNINISWNTLAEINTSHFVVQHSFDGSDFTDVESIDAKSLAGEFYDVSDQRIELGFHYYRLKIVDHDNTVSFSQIRVIRIENEEEIFSIYPNIASQNTTLNIEWFPTDNREVTKAVIMDIFGNEFISQRITLGANPISITGLTTGVYYVVLSDYNNKYSVKRFVVAY